MMKQMLFITAAAAMMSTTFSTATVAAGMPDVKHKGLECLVCHQKGFTPPKQETCLACHPSDVIVKATERFNFTTSFTNPKDGKATTSTASINPHDNFHYGRTDECVNCHREHKSSTLTCQTCHDVEPWKMKAPR